MSDKKLRILLIEDNPADARLIKEYCRNFEYFHALLTSVSSLNEGFGKLKNDFYDAILLDLSLPDSQGIESLQKLSKSFPGQTIIVLTGISDKNSAIAAVQEGAQDFLVKNELSPELLMRSILYAVERKRIGDKVAESEKKYRLLINTMNEGVLYVNNQNTVLFANHRFCEMTGYSMDELLGKKADSMLLGDQNNSMIKEKVELRKKGIADQYELLMQKKNGEKIWVLVNGTPIYDEKGEVIGSLGTHTEITEHKLNITKLLETNRELNTFIYKSSHDIRGPLASIIGLANLARMDVREPEALKYIDLIAQSTNRLDSILTDLLETIRIKQLALNLKQINFEHLLNFILKRVNHIEGYPKIEFKINIRRVNTFFTDHKILLYILQNMIDNAVRYQKKDVDNAFVHIDIVGSVSGVNIHIEDNGIGIHSDIKDSIFDMFYRGNLKSKGTGLGLYIVKIAVEKLRGTIDLKSDEGKGTKVLIYLPNLEKEMIVKGN